MKFGLGVLAVMAAVAVAGCSAAAAKDYSITLTRPEEMGNLFWMTATGSWSMARTVKVGDKVIDQKTEATTVILVARAEVLEVDSSGAPSSMALTVDKFRVKKGGAAEVEVLPRGTVITVPTTDGAKFFEVAGKPAPTEAAEALAMVVSLGRWGASEDEVFGTKDRKNLGDQWPINAELAAKDLAAKGITVAKKDLSGTVTIEAAEKVEGIEWLYIGVRMTSRKFAAPMPADVAVQKASFEYTGQVKLPVDPAARLPERSVEMTLKIAGKGKAPEPGTESSVDVILKSSVAVKYSPGEATIQPPRGAPCDNLVQSVVLLNGRTKEIDGRTYHLVVLGMDEGWNFGTDLFGAVMVTNIPPKDCGPAEEAWPPGKRPSNVQLMWLRLPEQGNLEILAGIAAVSTGTSVPAAQARARRVLLQLGYKPLVIPVKDIPTIHVEKAEDIPAAMAKVAPSQPAATSTSPATGTGATTSEAPRRE